MLNINPDFDPEGYTAPPYISYERAKAVYGPEHLHVGYWSGWRLKFEHKDIMLFVHSPATGPHKMILEANEQIGTCATVELLQNIKKDLDG